MVRIVKVSLIGDANIGKTQLCNIYTNKTSLNSKNLNYIPTLACNVFTIPISYYQFKIWDCSGNEKFQGLKEGYYIDSSIIVIMAKLTNSFSKNIIRWHKISQLTARNTPVIVIGHRTDNFNNSFEIQESVKNWFDSNNVKHEYIEIDIKNQINVYKPLESMVKFVEDNPLMIKNIKTFTEYYNE